MNKTLSLIRKCVFNLLYILAIIVCLTKVGEVNKITTYNISGIGSMKSSSVLSDYKEPMPPAEKILTKQSPTTYQYRLTSFYENDECDSLPCVGAGFCDKDFQLNEKGWYTYQGKLVIAAATPYMQSTFGVKPNKLYFRYYDELILTIDGVKYDAIVLDTCVACYKNEILDLFVKDKASAIDRGYRGQNMITVEIKKKQ